MPGAAPAPRRRPPVDVTRLPARAADAERELAEAQQQEDCAAGTIDWHRAAYAEARCAALEAIVAALPRCSTRTFDDDGEIVECPRVATKIVSGGWYACGTCRADGRPLPYADALAGLDVGEGP